MITDDRFPEELTKEEIDKLHKRARLSGLAITGAGGLVLIGNRIAGKKWQGDKVYRRLNRTGIGLAAGGAGLTGLSEYLHYKYRKEHENKKKD
jgi:hypothetical protein